MQLGTRVIDPKCARCGKIVTIPAHFQDGLWFHFSCWNAGADQLFKAETIARAVNPTLFIHVEPELL
jgi:hypothetical protein